MKFTAAILLTIFLSFISGIFFPWWGITLASFLAAILVHQKAWLAFIAGFLGLFLLWSGLAIWIDVSNDKILSGRISELLGLGRNTSPLIFISGLLGGLVAGFAAMCGSFLRKGR